MLYLNLNFSFLCTETSLSIHLILFTHVIISYQTTKYLSHFWQILIKKRLLARNFFIKDFNFFNFPWKYCWFKHRTLILSKLCSLFCQYYSTTMNTNTYLSFNFEKIWVKVAKWWLFYYLSDLIGIILKFLLSNRTNVIPSNFLEH